MISLLELRIWKEQKFRRYEMEDDKIGSPKIDEIMIKLSHNTKGMN